MRQFLRRLGSYWKWLVGFVLFFVGPFLKDQFASMAFDAAWNRVGGPVVLGELGALMSSHPWQSVGVAVVAYVVVLGLVSERHVRRAMRLPPVDAASLGGDRWVSIEVGRAEPQSGYGVLLRALGAALGGERTTQVIVRDIVATNHSSRHVTLTARLLVHNEDGVREGRVGNQEIWSPSGEPTKGNLKWLDYPVRLDPDGGCSHGQLAFEVDEKIFGDSRPRTYQVEFSDRSDPARAPILLSTPGRFDYATRDVAG